MSQRYRITPVYLTHSHSILWLSTAFLTVEIDDWNIVVIECKSLAAKWEQLSVYLGLSCDVIDNIKGSGDNYNCWSEALKHWIRQNFNTRKFGVPSWRSLLKAVAEVDKLQFKKLADKHQGKKTKV